jgi:hypothetical protein
MTDHEKYIETLEQLFFATRNFSEVQKRNENTFAVLSDLSALISTFYSSLDRLQGERKINAENTIKTLQRVFSEIGSSYLLELYFRNKCGQYEKALIEASKKIENLENEIILLNNLETFGND